MTTPSTAPPNNDALAVRRHRITRDAGACRWRRPMSTAGGRMVGVAGTGAAGAMAVTSAPVGGLNGGGLLQMASAVADGLAGSVLAFNRETRHGGTLSFWSRGARSHFAGRDGVLSLGGDVRTMMFGADYAKGPLVAGLSLSHSRGLGEYAGTAGGQVGLDSYGPLSVARLQGDRPRHGLGRGRLRGGRAAADTDRRARPGERVVDGDGGGRGQGRVGCRGRERLRVGIQGHATGRASRVASIPRFHTCRRHYPGGTGRCARRSLPDR